MPRGRRSHCGSPRRSPSAWAWRLRGTCCWRCCNPPHPLRAAAGVYLCAAALTLAGIELARGYAWPLAGVYVWLCAAALLAAPLLARLARAARRPAPAHAIALTELPAQRD
ncbi:MAG: hypothetical protein EXR63_02590 [Dehalococcoidia bacterium]|nr:hypothetical protein [Dehalococcoidia bacterium]